MISLFCSIMFLLTIINSNKAKKKRIEEYFRMFSKCYLHLLSQWKVSTNGHSKAVRMTFQLWNINKYVGFYTFKVSWKDCIQSWGNKL